MKDPIVTIELIRLLKAERGLTRETFAYLGVSWPLTKGWVDRILDKPRQPIERVISKDLYE